MYYKAFSVTGVVNSTVLDGGLVSLVEIPVHIDAILITVQDWQGNTIEGWIGNERILEIPDYILDSDADLGAANFPVSSTKLIRIPVDHDIPAGQIFKIGINCGATAANIFGSYEYTKLS